MTYSLSIRLGTTCLPLLVAGCAIFTPPASVPAALPAQWQATPPLPVDPKQLPHGGELTDLSRWWADQGDAVLVQMIDAAQAANADIAAAASRIAQARSTVVAAGAALLPTVDGALNTTRSSAQPPLPLGTATVGALQTAWEIDLFGGGRVARRSAQARLEGAQAAWHDARILVAAEVANRYYSLRACDALTAITRADAGSRNETARLAGLSAGAGFQAPATAALARASAAESNARATQQAAQCDLDIKALTFLTAIPEADLRLRLRPARQEASETGKDIVTDGETPVLSTLMPGKAIAIHALPAAILAQRPDIFAAGRDVDAASADVGTAEAQRYPRLSLSGSIGAANFRTGGVSTNLSTWSIGPLALTVPIFDGGRRAADADAARARYEAAAARYRSSVRQAVREVEENLVNLQSTAARNTDALTAVDGYRSSFNATESRYRSGLASLVELEETRRTRLAAEVALVSLQRERSAAWIGLYRAAGGGWKPADVSTAPGRQ